MRILLVDDHKTMLWGLERLIQADPAAYVTEVMGNRSAGGVSMYRGTAAEAGQHGVKAAAARVKQARAMLRNARADRFPELTAGLSANLANHAVFQGRLDDADRHYAEALALPDLSTLSLTIPVAMGYVPTALSTPGTRLEGEVRGKRLPMRVTPMPFAPHHYKR